MPSFLECCENQYGTRDLYQLLHIQKDATAEEVKKAYRRLSLIVHPDRVGEDDKEIATEKFKILGKAYSILSDEEKRKVYDDTGCVDEDSSELSDRDWGEYWRLLFKEITFQDIADYEKTYKGSETELEDLQKAYTDGRGSMDHILAYVPFSCPAEEERLRGRLEALIQAGQLQAYPAFTQESQELREARKRKWEKEAKAAEKAKKELSQKKSKRGGGKTGGGAAAGQSDDLVAALMERRRGREAEAENLFKYLEEKYAQPTKPKGRKAKK